MLVGAVAASVSVIGFVWVQPWLEQRSPIKVRASSLLTKLYTNGVCIVTRDDRH